MKHHFILNPAAGKGDRYDEFKQKIHDVCTARSVDFCIYETTGVGDATRYVRSAAEGATDVQRFYACGGDGTLDEVVFGGAGLPNVEFGLIPIGTGNDFWRNFTEGENFFDIGRQLDGEAIAVDGMKFGDQVCINMINIGFDCNVVDTVAKIKRRSYIPSNLAYIAGLVVQLFRKIGTQVRMKFDNGEVIDYPLTLTAISGGAYCGGGFHSSPKSSLKDGMIDLCIVKKVSVFTFLSLVKFYKAGTYLENERAMKVIRYLHAKSVAIEFDKPTNVCFDGEVKVMKELTIEALPDYFRFSVPQGSSLILPEETKTPANV